VTQREPEILFEAVLVVDRGNSRVCLFQVMVALLDSVYVCVTPCTLLVHVLIRKDRAVGQKCYIDLNVCDRLGGCKREE